MSRRDALNRSRPAAGAAVMLAAVLAAAPGMILGQGAPPPALVRVEAVVEREVHASVELVGSALPRRRTIVAARTAGAVETMLVDEGSAVKTGDPLAVIDTRVLILEIEGAAATQAETAARLARARDRLRRSNALFEKGRISEEEHQDDVHAEAALAQEALRADAARRRLEAHREWATVRAPYDGVVAAKRTEVGAWVAEGGGVAELVDLSAVRIRLDLPERYLPRIQRGLPVEVRADSIPGRTLSGRLFAVVPVADLQARTVPVEVEVPNPDGSLHAGMFFRATVPLDEKRTVRTVPKDALVDRGTGHAVFVVENDVAREVAVERLGSYEGDVEVTGDLRPGAWVVIRGNERLRSGQPVRREDGPAPAPGPPADGPGGRR